MSDRDIVFLFYRYLLARHGAYRSGYDKNAFYPFHIWLQQARLGFSRSQAEEIEYTINELINEYGDITDMLNAFGLLNAKSRAALRLDEQLHSRRQRINRLMEAVKKEDDEDEKDDVYDHDPYRKDWDDEQDSDTNYPAKDYEICIEDLVDDKTLTEQEAEEALSIIENAYGYRECLHNLLSRLDIDEATAIEIADSVEEYEDEKEERESHIEEPDDAVITRIKEESYRRKLSESIANTRELKNTILDMAEEGYIDIDMFDDIYDVLTDSTDYYEALNRLINDCYLEEETAAELAAFVGSNGDYSGYTDDDITGDTSEISLDGELIDVDSAEEYMALLNALDKRGDDISSDVDEMTKARAKEQAEIEEEEARKRGEDDRDAILAADADEVEVEMNGIEIPKKKKRGRPPKNA